MTAISELTRAVDESLYAAVNANRTCAVLSRSIATLQLKSDVFAHRVETRLKPDLLLESRLQPVRVGWRLEIELIHVAEGVCLFNWQEDLQNVEHEVQIELLTARFSARFEIDLQLALIKL